MKSVYYILKHENVLTWQKKVYHAIIADSGNDVLSQGKNDSGDKRDTKALDSFPFDAAVLFRSKNKKQVFRKKPKGFYDNLLWYIILKQKRRMLFNLWYSIGFRHCIEISKLRYWCERCF